MSQWKERTQAELARLAETQNQEEARKKAAQEQQRLNREQKIVADNEIIAKFKGLRVDSELQRINQDIWGGYGELSETVASKAPSEWLRNLMGKFYYIYGDGWTFVLYELKAKVPITTEKTEGVYEKVYGHYTEDVNTSMGNHVTEYRTGWHNVPVGKRIVGSETRSKNSRLSVSFGVNRDSKHDLCIVSVADDYAYGLKIPNIINGLVIDKAGYNAFVTPPYIEINNGLIRHPPRGDLSAYAQANLSFEPENFKDALIGQFVDNLLLQSCTARNGFLSSMYVESARKIHEINSSIGKVFPI